MKKVDKGLVDWLMDDEAHGDRMTRTLHTQLAILKTLIEIRDSLAITTTKPAGSIQYVKKGKKN